MDSTSNKLVPDACMTEMHAFKMEGFVYCNLKLLHIMIIVKTLFFFSSLSTIECHIFIIRMRKLMGEKLVPVTELLLSVLTRKFN